MGERETYLDELDRLRDEVKRLREEADCYASLLGLYVAGHKYERGCKGNGGLACYNCRALEILERYGRPVPAGAPTPPPMRGFCDSCGREGEVREKRETSVVCKAGCPRAPATPRGEPDGK